MREQHGTSGAAFFSNRWFRCPRSSYNVEFAPDLLRLIEIPMSASASRPLQLTSGQLAVSLTLPAHAIVHQLPPHAAAETSRQIAQALQHPLGLPGLHECAIPGDRIVIVLDPDTPAGTEIVGQVVEQLQLPGEGAAALTLLLPEDPAGHSWQSLQASLPLHVQQLTAVQVHNPADETQRGYLASSSGGERVYLNRQLLDADLIVSIGMIGFDSLLGYRGTSSVIYPQFSDAATIREVRGQGHPELTPDQRRPLRDLVDEIGWLLGTQFTVQVLPDAAGGAAEVLAGAPDQVQACGQSRLDQSWRVATDEACDLVVVSIPGGSPFGWKQLGTALDMACRVVEPGGRIAIVAQLETPEGDAAAMLRRCKDPEDLLKPLRREPTADAVEISQLIQALRRARLYLLSGLPAELVEELGLYALASADELQRLVDQSERLLVIPGANFAWCDITATV